MEYMEERYEELPSNIAQMLLNFGESEGSYRDCAKLVGDLEKEGWTMEYGLDAEPYNLRTIKNKTDV